MAECRLKVTWFSAQRRARRGLAAACPEPARGVPVPHDEHRFDPGCVGVQRLARSGRDGALHRVSGRPNPTCADAVRSDQFTSLLERGRGGQRGGTCNSISSPPREGSITSKRYAGRRGNLTRPPTVASPLRGRSLMKRKKYEKTLQQAAGAALPSPTVGQGEGPARHHRLRGAGRRRKGRHDQGASPSASALACSAWLRSRRLRTAKSRSSTSSATCSISPPPAKS